MMTRKHFRHGTVTCLLILTLAFVCRGQPGQVASWGTSLGGQYEPEPGDEYMAICAGGYHTLALTASGTLVAWGENAKGQCNVPAGDDFVAIAAGRYHNLALTALAKRTLLSWISL